MKRKIVITEYNDGPQWEASRSRIDRILDYFCGAPDVSDFYPRSKKRSYFADGRTFKTVSFSNGILFGGCMMDGCVNSCIPLKDFCPSDPPDAQAFAANLQVHDAAVTNRDIEMATEYRVILEASRSDVCLQCKARVQHSPRPQEHSTPRSSTDTHADTHADTQESSNSTVSDGPVPDKGEDGAEQGAARHSVEGDEEEVDADGEEGEAGGENGQQQQHPLRPSMPRPNKQQ
tara:strand:- start:537 stop:1232 length:696 start_codon:yes stop_codon:yes gene_type:complete